MKIAAAFLLVAAVWGTTTELAVPAAASGGILDDAELVCQVPIFNPPSTRTEPWTDCDALGVAGDCSDCPCPEGGSEKPATTSSIGGGSQSPPGGGRGGLGQASAVGPGGGGSAGLGFRRSTGSGRILPHSGQEILDQTDLVILGRDRSVDLEIKRRHTTRRNEVNSMFGPGWAFNYRHTMSFASSSDPMVFEGFGRTDTFEVDPRLATSGEFHWNGTRGRLGRAFWRPADSTVTVRRPNGVKMVFHVERNAADTMYEGHLVKIVSPNANAIQIIYEASSVEPDLLKRRILRILESWFSPKGVPIDERALWFRYSEDEGREHLCVEIIDFARRSLVYGYEFDGEHAFLMTQRSPTVGQAGQPNSFPDGKTTRYTYLRSSEPDLTFAVTSVTKPREVAAGGPACLQWTYEEDTADKFFGFVKTHTVGGGGGGAGGTFGYSYADLTSGPTTGTGANRAVIRTTVVDRRGVTIQLDLNELGQMLREEIIENPGMRPGQSFGSFVRSFTYTEDGALLSSSDPLDGANQGLFMEYPSLDPMQTLEMPRAYDANQRERRHDSNDPAEGSIKRVVIHEPVFGHPFQITDERAS